MVPTSQATYTDARLRGIANAVMISKIVPLLDKVREGFYSYDVDTTIVAGSGIRVHSRAVGAKLEGVSLLNGTSRLEPTRYYEEELSDTTVAPSRPGFYLKRNKLFVLPDGGGGWTTLRQSILMRPNKIVPQDEAAQVTAINTGTKVVTCTTVPSDWLTSDTFDLVEQNPHFDWLAIDQAISAITTGASGTLAFSSALPSDLAVGDWISLAGETPIIQCPVDLHPLFAQEVANVLLTAQTDRAARELSAAETKLLREAAETAVNPRVQKEAKNLCNRTGILRRGM